MSSRILPEDAAVPVEPIRWSPAGAAPVAAQTSLEATPCYTWTAPNPQEEEAATHRARVEAFERELARQVEEARRAGYAEAERKLKQAVEEMLGRLAASIEEIAAFRKRFRQQAEEDLVQLAFAISRRILRRELSADPEAILGLVRSALDRLAASEVHRVKVHPESAPSLRRHLEALRSEVAIEVAADGSLAPGSVLFETARGTLDASVETQLREIERGFTDLLHRRH